MYQFIKDVKPVDWWVSQADRVHPETVSVAKQLLTATSSSAGVQRESNHKCSSTTSCSKRYSYVHLHCLHSNTEMMGSCSIHNILTVILQLKAMNVTTAVNITTCQSITWNHDKT